MKNKNEDFLEGIEINNIDWNSIDTSKVPEDCDKNPIDYEFEGYRTDFPDDLERVLDIVNIVEESIQSRAKELNEGIYNSMKQKNKYLVKLDDDVVYEKIIDSTIKYKNTRHFNDLYSLYRRLSDKDIRKLCYTEIHSMYVEQIRKAIVKKPSKFIEERNKKIFDLIDKKIRYAEIAAMFDLSEISIRKLAAKYKATKK